MAISWQHTCPPATADVLGAFLARLAARKGKTEEIASRKKCWRNTSRNLAATHKHRVYKITLLVCLNNNKSYAASLLSRDTKSTATPEQTKAVSTSHPEHGLQQGQTVGQWLQEHPAVLFALPHGSGRAERLSVSWHCQQKTRKVTGGPAAARSSHQRWREKVFTVAA